MRYLIPVHFERMLDICIRPPPSHGGTTSYVTTIVPPLEVTWDALFHPPNGGKLGHFLWSEIHTVTPHGVSYPVKHIPPPLEGMCETTFALYWRENGPFSSESKLQITHIHPTLEGN